MHHPSDYKHSDQITKKLPEFCPGKVKREMRQYGIRPEAVDFLMMIRKLITLTIRP